MNISSGLPIETLCDVFQCLAAERLIDPRAEIAIRDARLVCRAWAAVGKEWLFRWPLTSSTVRALIRTMIRQTEYGNETGQPSSSSVQSLEYEEPLFEDLEKTRQRLPFRSPSDDERRACVEAFRREFNDLEDPAERSRLQVERGSIVEHLLDAAPSLLLQRRHTYYTDKIIPHFLEDLRWTLTDRWNFRAGHGYYREEEFPAFGRYIDLATFCDKKTEHDGEGSAQAPLPVSLFFPPWTETTQVLKVTKPKGYDCGFNHDSRNRRQDWATVFKSEIEAHDIESFQPRSFRGSELWDWSSPFSDLGTPYATPWSPAVTLRTPPPITYEHLAELVFDVKSGKLDDNYELFCGAKVTTEACKDPNTGLSSRTITFSLEFDHGS
ncbi:hypothetical protein BDZ88DRAFT_122774 [Geranomyces variabilis]|nr:hypothetical protein BDZ88DRAFT_122774 [Geranomyces variabilis]KAJ3136319.1 hypothetical protein HDU90_003371 [Geranomyces variabilis]